MKYLALDFGEKRMGLAGSDSGSVIMPLEVVSVVSDDYDGLIQKINQYNPQYLIIGLPVSTDGQEKNSAKKVKQFVQEIRNKIVVKNIKYTNEIYTSVEAQERANQIGWKKGQPIDHFAAAVILEQFLNTIKTSN